MEKDSHSHLREYAAKHKNMRMFMNYAKDVDLPEVELVELYNTGVIGCGSMR